MNGVFGVEHLAFQAFVFGIISAVSLPMGALTVLVYEPRERTIAGMMAFGAGALLAALTIDLVGDALAEGHFYSLAVGCVCGGLLFNVLNHAINTRGGFLRKAATTFSYLRKKKTQQFRLIAKKMSTIPLFNLLPSREIQKILGDIIYRTYPRGSFIFRQGDMGDSLFIIDQGIIDIIDDRGGGKKIASLRENDVVGEMALITGQHRSYSAYATTDVRVWIVLKEHFDRLLGTSPEFTEAVSKLVSHRIGDLRKKREITPKQSKKWLAEIVHTLDARITHPTETDIREAASMHAGVPVAIWLGILLDGIPESLVIGASIINNPVSLSLIAGLFLSNYPEALSSSIGMRRQNYAFSKIFWMWSSLMIFTGIGAFFGNALFLEAPAHVFALTEGVAAGAMLTMIAETMLPEAYHKGGSITGLATLFGFLVAIFFKTLEY